MTSKVIYKGALRTEAIHIRSGNTIITDAPTDNKGKGEAFSPTDLVATALAQFDLKSLSLLEVFTRLVLALAVLMRPETIHFTALIFTACLLTFHITRARRINSG